MRTLLVWWGGLSVACSGDTSDAPKGVPVDGGDLVSTDTDTDSDADTDADTDTDADSDSDADADTDTDSDADTDTATTAGCAYPDVPVPDQGPVAIPMVDPTWVRLDMQGQLDSGAFHDFELDGSELSATLTFTLLNDAFVALCTVGYELDTAVLSPIPTSVSGGIIWEMLTPVMADGDSTCGTVDPARWGSDDIRDHLEGIAWQIGFGEMTPSIESPLQAQITGAGQDWIADWAPYVFSFYVASTGLADEMGWAFDYDETCGLVDYDPATQEFDPDPVPFGPPLSGYFVANSTLVYSL